MLQTPPMVVPLQRETRGVLSRVHWVYGMVVSGSQPIIIPLQPIALGATSEVHWFYGALTNIYHSRLSWNERYHSLENSTHVVNNKETPKLLLT